MPFVCSVPKCSNKRGGHRFPLEHDRLQLWLKATRMETYMPTKHSRVCRSHFTEYDYELPKDSVLDNPCPLLKKDAVPSIFPWNSNIAKKKRPQGKTIAKFTLPLKFEINDSMPTNSSTNISNFHFKSKRDSKNQIDKNPSQRTKVIGTLNKPGSETETPPKIELPEPKTELINNLNTLTNNILRDTDNMDVVICQEALKYLSQKFKSSSPDLSRKCNIPKLPPDVTITRRKQDNVVCEVDEKGLNETSREDVHYNLSPSYEMTLPVECKLSEYPEYNIPASFSSPEWNEKRFCLEYLMDITNPAEVQFFTGFKDYDQLQYVFKLLGDDVNYCMNFSQSTVQSKHLSPYHAFLLTVVKLRRNKLFTELGFKFRISTEQAEFIFERWINFLFNKFKNISEWLPQHVIDRYTRYGKGNPSIIIIECAGLKLIDAFKQTKINLDKSIKVFVSINGSGSSDYVSETLPGSLSDGDVIRNCTLEAKCKGVVSTSDIETDIITNEALNTKKIEKVIGLSKLYTILNGKMEYSLVRIANKIVFVCFMLTNFIKKLGSEEKFVV